jgi:Mn2+/Fe2+ NRAMP family transporter
VIKTGCCELTLIFFDLSASTHSAPIKFSIIGGNILKGKIVTALIWIVGIIGGVVAGVLIFIGLCLLFYTPKY